MILSFNHASFTNSKRNFFKCYYMKFYIEMSVCSQSKHCVKSVQIRSFFWSYFPVFGLNNYGNLRSKSAYSVRIQGNTDQKKLLIWTLLTKWRSSSAYRLMTCYEYQTFSWPLQKSHSTTNIDPRVQTLKHMV